MSLYSQKRMYVVDDDQEDYIEEDIDDGEHFPIRSSDYTGVYLGTGPRIGQNHPPSSVNTHNRENTKERGGPRQQARPGRIAALLQTRPPQPSSSSSSSSFSALSAVQQRAAGPRRDAEQSSASATYLSSIEAVSGDVSPIVNRYGIQTFSRAFGTMDPALTVSPSESDTLNSRLQQPERRGIRRESHPESLDAWVVKDRSAKKLTFENEKSQAASRHAVLPRPQSAHDRKKSVEDAHSSARHPRHGRSAAPNLSGEEEEEDEEENVLMRLARERSASASYATQTESPKCAIPSSPPPPLRSSSSSDSSSDSSLSSQSKSTASDLSTTRTPPSSYEGGQRETRQHSKHRNLDSVMEAATVISSSPESHRTASKGSSSMSHSRASRYHRSNGASNDDEHSQLSKTAQYFIERESKKRRQLTERDVIRAQYLQNRARYRESVEGPRRDRIARSRQHYFEERQRRKEKARNLILAYRHSSAEKKRVQTADSVKKTQTAVNYDPHGHSVKTPSPLSTTGKPLTHATYGLNVTPSPQVHNSSHRSSSAKGGLGSTKESRGDRHTTASVSASAKPRKVTVSFHSDANASHGGPDGSGIARSTSPYSLLKEAEEIEKQYSAAVKDVAIRRDTRNWGPSSSGGTNDDDVKKHSTLRQKYVSPPLDSTILLEADTNNNNMSSDRRCFFLTGAMADAFFTKNLSVLLPKQLSWLGDAGDTGKVHEANKNVHPEGVSPQPRNPAAHSKSKQKDGEDTHRGAAAANVEAANPSSFTPAGIRKLLSRNAAHDSYMRWLAEQEEEERKAKEIRNMAPEEGAPQQKNHVAGILHHGASPSTQRTRSPQIYSPPAPASTSPTLDRGAPKARESATEVYSASNLRRSAGLRSPPKPHVRMPPEMLSPTAGSSSASQSRARDRSYTASTSSSRGTLPPQREAAEASLAPPVSAEEWFDRANKALEETRRMLH